MTSAASPSGPVSLPQEFLKRRLGRRRHVGGCELRDRPRLEELYMRSAGRTRVRGNALTNDGLAVQTVPFIRPCARTSRLIENARAKRHGRPFLMFRLKDITGRGAGRALVHRLKSQVERLPARQSGVASRMRGRPSIVGKRKRVDEPAADDEAANSWQGQRVHDQVAGFQAPLGARRKGGRKSLGASLLDLDIGAQQRLVGAKGLFVLAGGLLSSPASA